jgi:RNA polymerase sigma-70 factor, ECF subfamily
MEQTTDLISLAKQGDSAAFGALYEEYAPTIYRFLRRRLYGPDEIVEDLTEDVFVKVFEKLGQYEDRGRPFAAWLYRVAQNRLVDYLRAAPRSAATSLDNVSTVAERNTDSAFSSVLDRQVLAPALAQLTAEQRRVIELRFIEAMSVADTAIVMERTEEAVKKLQARGLASLRRLLTATPAAAGRSLAAQRVEYAVA